MTYYNPRDVKPRRANLRQRMPAPEVVLWTKLRNRQLLGKKFRRQFGIGPYIVDFYCPELKLAVEIDGESHFLGDGPKRDARRDAVIAQSGITVLHVPNHEVMQNLDGVLELLAGTILERIKSVPAYPTRPGLPARKR